MAEGRGLDPQCSRIQSASDGCRPPGRSTFHFLAFGGWRAHSKPMPRAAPAVFKTAPATRPVHHPDLVVTAGFEPAAFAFGERRSNPVELRDGCRRHIAAC